MPLTPHLQKALEANLFEELQLNELPLAEKEKILLDVGEIINKRILLRITEALPDERAEELETLLADYADQPEKIEIFFRQEIPNLEEIVQEEIADYKDTLLKRLGGKV